jgi:NAD(P)-dependent dehydrogenase (short-subunit alcohol dehydrogenase family)
MTMTGLFDLTGKVAVVTGGGRGLGRAMAGGLASAGAKIMIGARSTDEIEETAAVIRDSRGEAGAFAVDATDRASCETFIASAIETFGGLDIAVINHGVGGGAAAAETAPDLWDRALSINLTGAFNVAQIAARAMIGRGSGGSIIVTSSTASLVAFENLLAYGASKGGVDQMVRQMALEWGRHRIRVNAVNPGYTTHGMRTSAEPRDEDEAFEAAIRNRTPLGRRGEPEEFIGPVVFLASEASSFVTGVCLPVDGGYCAA